MVTALGRAWNRPRRGCLGATFDLVLSLILFGMTCGVLAGLVQATAYQASYRLAEEFAGFASKDSVYASVPDSWWELHDKDHIFKQAGGWKRGVNWNELRQLMLFAPFAACVAVLGAIKWRWVKAKGLVLRFALAALVAGVGLTAYYLDSNAAARFEWPMTVAEWKVGVPVAIGSYLACTTCLLAAAFVGRPMARFVVQVFVPVALHVDYHELWTVDGLTTASEPA